MRSPWSRSGTWNASWRGSARSSGVNHRRLEAVLDATGDAIAMYDTENRLVFANRWYQELVELTQEDLRRMSPEAVSAHFRARFRKSRLSVAVAGAVEESIGDAVMEPVADTEQTKLFVHTERPVRDPEGAVLGDLMVYRDVSSEIEIEQMKQEVQRLQAELEATYSFGGIVGGSAGMQQVYALIRQAAAGDIAILIRGESGTGKELVAKAVHFNGRRKTGPFLAVNCAAVPETLVESELFGHERGAFSGATTRHIGCFERANGGTILLDEITDMRPALQAKLLRVLQEREIQRVGGTTTIPIDVQVIAATNRDPQEVMRSGSFREDLYYRIAAFPILIPPLRERRDDGPAAGGALPEALRGALPAGRERHLRQRAATVAAVRLARQRTRTGGRHRARRAAGDDGRPAARQPAARTRPRRPGRRPAGDRPAVGAGRAAGAGARPCGLRQQRGGRRPGAPDRSLHAVPEAQEARPAGSGRSASRGPLTSVTPGPAPATMGIRPLSAPPAPAEDSR